jgi:hypothetical protein
MTGNVIKTTELQHLHCYTIWHVFQLYLSEGVGFVTFEDEAEADNACKNYYQTLLGKKVEVKLAEPRNRSPGEVHRQQQFIYSDHHLISTG